jgi:hypothetical protein
MGSGRWSTDVYEEMERARAARGESAFAHYDRARASGKLEAHPTLNPIGVTFRESRDSDEHPQSNAIAVFLDVTGSMSRVPRVVQERLPQLLGLLLYKNYIPHPQILFGAIGDATCDRVPLQVGQFESDNRMDTHLQNLILEGGGGAGMSESYELALYFMARHTSVDCWEKRRKKGYLFMIGDEMAYPKVKRSEVNDLIGAGLQDDIPLAQIVTELKEKYHVFYIIPGGASNSANAAIPDFWRETLGGQSVIRLEDANDVSELIALTIGANEGTVGLDDGIADLRAVGASDATVQHVRSALATFAAPGSIIRGRSLDDETGGEGGSTRRL